MARSMKAVVLAAGSCDQTRNLLMRQLGNSTVVEQSLASVTAVIPQSDVVIVVDAHDDSIPKLLGDSWTYVRQNVQAGTGDAVRCARFQLDGFEGDVLVAYADTPMVKASSLRGLIWKHHLKESQFSLLTAMVDDPGDYGRILRDDQARIVEIVEASDLSTQTSAIVEVNVGAYVIDSSILIPRLDEMAAIGEHRLTELAERLIAEGNPVASYAILDVDEVQGINTDEELKRAEDIVLKRLFEPSHALESHEIFFGTGGWRAKIGEGFTLHNVRRLCQAIANQVTRTGTESKGVVIGGDRRFLSAESVRVAAEVFAGNNILTRVLRGDVPTPLVTFAAPHTGSQYSLVFTASHNPPQWNGLKVFRADGSLPLNDETDAFQDEANSLRNADVVTIDYGTAMNSGLITEIDLTNAYVEAIETQIDIPKMRAAKPLRVLIDPMYGTSQLTLGLVLSDARVRAEFIHAPHNPLFGGKSPAPDAAALTTLIDMVKNQGTYDLGLATDGDSDRIGIVDETGRYVSTNELLVLIYWYLHEMRGEQGGVVRNLSTTHLIDRLADHFGEPHVEVPVGFKYITAGMAQINAVLGGESSGGLTIRGWILGKDGIFACALVCEMLAVTGKKLSVLLDEVFAITGRATQIETGIPATPDMKVEIPRRITESQPTTIAGIPVVTIDTYDGFKITLDNGSWVLLRFSGTEPILRMIAEAADEVHAQELIDWVHDYAGA
ncbi:MAG: NTP transferase domain-containing protein [Propionibacteriaceae bacterium]|jgi:phosphomannomutase/dTDP-glucose pyrophosphorylase|nr:NTP transferase domain-containing protein [Propionibacteriaceae bacterium]